MSEQIKLPPTHQQYSLEANLRQLRECYDSTVSEQPALAYACHDQVRAQLQIARQLIEDAYQKAAETGCLNLPENKRPPKGFVFV